MIILRIPIISELFEYTKNFLGELCALFGLTVGIVVVIIVIYYRKRKKEK